jgi:hypothetical protein
MASTATTATKQAASPRLRRAARRSPPVPAPAAAPSGLSASQAPAQQPGRGGAGRWSLAISLPVAWRKHQACQSNS